MVRPLGSKDRIRRKYKYSFARQYLHDHGIQVYNGDKQVLTPVPYRLYNIKLPNTRYFIGEQFIEEGEIRVINKYEELKDIGFVVVSTSINSNSRWETGQKVRYVLVREEETGEHLNKLPRNHFVEHDSYNKAVRLIGPRSGPMGAGPWIVTERKVRTSVGSGRKPEIMRLHKDADKIMKRQAMIWRGEEAKPKPVYIPEVAFMVTKSNEIVCFPQTDDMPSILISGMKRCQIGTDTVLMANKKFKPIKDIKVGDIVLSPQHDGSVIPSKVLKTISYYCNDVYKIKELNHHKKTLYTCSGNHIIPLLKKNQIKHITASNYSILSNENKQKSNIILSLNLKKSFNNKTLQLPGFFMGDSIDAVSTKPDIVYGFTVDSPSNWYITNDYVITHNSGKCILQEGKDDYVIDGFGRFVQIKDKPRTVLAVNKDLKLEKTRVKNYYDRETKEIIIIKTRSGKEVKLTPEHLMLTVKGWKQAQKLNIGEYLATPRKYNLMLSKKISLSQVKLLGYIIGSAILTEKKLRFDFKTEDYDVKVSIQNCLANIDRSLKYHKRKISSRSKHNTLTKYLEILGIHNLRRDETFIPNRIMELCDDQIKLFLSSYYSVSGHVHKKINSIYFTSRSKIVSKQLQHLLLRFGIKSVLTAKRRKFKKSKSVVHLFEIGIMSVEDKLKLIEILNPLPLYKTRDLAKVYNNIKDIRKNTGNHDIIPKEIWSLASPKDWHNSFKELGYALKRSQTDNLDFNVTRETIKKIAKGSNNKILNKFASSDIYWDEVISITRKKGKFKVWDIEVEHDSHNFIANDIIVHNSFCLHSLVSRFFWKPSFNFNMCILNDSSRETGTWVLPNNDIDQINILRRLNERPLPLPCVYFHPLVKENYEKLYIGDVGFNITIPFKEIVDNHKHYLNLKDSARYFTKIVDELRECKSEEAAQSLFDQFVLHYNMPIQTANKIRAEFDTLFDSKMTDISTEGQELWSTSKNPKAVYNPLTTAVHTGVIPVLETEFVSNYKDILSIYFRYFAGDLFMRQKQDIDFLEQKSEIMLIVDEAHNISQKARRTGADALLRRCVREGGPRRIGTLLATQKFGELPDVIKDNSTYLIVFKNPGEASLIANQYNMGKYVSNIIRDLGKHECLAYTTDHFIVYDTDGNKRKSKLNETFIGKTLPPYSLHKKPKSGGS